MTGQSYIQQKKKLLLQTPFANVFVKSNFDEIYDTESQLDNNWNKNSFHGEKLVAL